MSYYNVTFCFLATNFSSASLTTIGVIAIIFIILVLVAVSAVVFFFIHRYVTTVSWVKCEKHNIDMHNM